VVCVGVAVVGGDEFAAVDDLVAHGRDIVLPATASQEAQRVAAVLVPRKRSLDMATKRVLRDEGRGQVEQAGHAQALGDRSIELLDVCDADDVKHLPLDARGRVRNVGIGGWGLAHLPDLLVRNQLMG
jgi:hypothetical protein